MKKVIVGVCKVLAVAWCALGIVAGVSHGDGWTIAGNAVLLTAVLA